MISKQLRLQWKEEYCKEWYQFVCDDSSEYWSHSCLSNNPNITWEIVKNNPDKKWSYIHLSENPNITWE